MYVLIVAGMYFDRRCEYTGCCQIVWGSYMTKRKLIGIILAQRALVALPLVMATPAAVKAATVFQDSFAWGNERGDWRTGSRQYDAALPDNTPPTYSSVVSLPNLTNFTVNVTVNRLDDGGIWLRSNYNGGNINGILLVTGGKLGTHNGFYWHVFVNGVASPPLNLVDVPNIQGKNVKLRIVVTGNTYRLFINSSATPVSTLVNSTFSSGRVGLYDFSPTDGATSPRGQTFSTFSISVP